MEHNEEQQNTMRDAILGRIRSQKLHMHPRYYFYARVIALTLVSAGIFFVTAFICNFLLFSIRVNSSDSYLFFGPRGWAAFIQFFPWDLFAIDLLLVAALLWLLRQFKFGYKSPVLYIVLLLILVTVTAGALLDRATDFNDRALNAADAHRLPGPVNIFYGNAHRLPPPGEGVCKCVVVSSEGGVLTVYDLRASTTPFTVALPPNDPRATTSGLEPGDVIFVAGQRIDGSVDAFGIRKIYFAAPAQPLK